ncbi:hypothetical protein DRJ22_00365 [Candidatus Woesearchaeota archaeon]|nr:MAG: hypothetical protein DRJ22_00365 [Candidatus Woesearchaeota archaeon]
MNYYDIIADGYDELYAEEQRDKVRKIKKVLNFIDVKPYFRLLDVGCGSGVSAELFDCDKTGIDPSKELLKRCGFPVVLGVAEDLPFLDDEFDIVISFTAIHNFNNVVKGLKEMRRVGKKWFVFSVLKKSVKFDFIRANIFSLFRVVKEVDVGKDVCFVCDKF